MAIVGGVTGSASGRTFDHILSIEAEVIAGNVLLSRMQPASPYRRNYYAPYINGVYLGTNQIQHLKEDIQVAATIPSANPVASIYYEDAGRWQNFGDSTRTPSSYAEFIEALSANMIQFKWTGSYEVTTPAYDSQIVIDNLTGAERNFNLESVPNKPTRGRLYYSITSDGSDYTVRFWMGSTLVAQGNRTGNGAMTCTEVNFSNLTIDLTLTYTADLKAGIAFVECRWPSAYQIHYSTSALSYPRTPEAFVEDTGLSDYIFLSPRLGAGTYFFNVLQIDDGTNIQSSNFVTTTPLTINSSPDATTGTALSIVTVTGKKYIQIDFDVADALTTHNIYSSPSANTPIDFYHPITTGSLVHTALIATVAPDTAVGLPMIDASQIDNTAAYTTLASAFDTLVADCNTAYDAGEAAFDADFTTALDGLQAAILAYGSTLDEDLSEYVSSLLAYGQLVLSSAANVTGLGLTDDDWHTATKATFGHFLAFVGSLLVEEIGRYSFSDGTLLTNDDGTIANTLPTSGLSLYEAGLPFIQDAQFRTCVRAIKSGIEEQSNTEITLTLNADGTTKLPVPNAPSIESETITGFDIDIKASVLEDNTDVEADSLVLWLDEIGTPLDLDNTGSTQAIIISLSASIVGYHSNTFNASVSTSGWYHYAVKSKANTQLSEPTETREIFVEALSNSTHVNNLIAKVIRGK